MRVVSGIYKSRRFEVPSHFKLRPTTDFAKENIFNVLNNFIDFEGLSALDLFSGTGSISIELASRGCTEVVSIEKNAQHHAFIQKVVKTLGANVYPIKGDVLRYLAGTSGTFDFIFADPPYDLPELETIPSLVFNNNRLKKGCYFVLEHSQKNHFEQHPFFLQHREYGSVNFTIFHLPE